MTTKKLIFLAPLLIILALHLGLSITYSVATPLSEAPDEPAHFSYAQFIAKNGRLPATLEERQEAGYRAVWPPLYHALVAVPIAMVGNSPPTRLKSVGDSPRRLIPTNGQTIASTIHTFDESWPWRGITLAWHLARLISVTLTALTVIVTYLIAWRLTKNRWVATTAAAITAFLPQFLFTGTIVTDDTLLILLSSLILLTLVVYTQRTTFPNFARFLFLGALLGLTTITKYNTLSLWGVVLVWLVWQSIKVAGSKKAGNKGASSRVTGMQRRSVEKTDSRPSASSPLRLFASSLIAILLGATLTAGWWFVFIWRTFNQVDLLGPIDGSLAALSAGTADASLRRLSGGGLITLPPFADWPVWVSTLFNSFWGLFGGGGTIAFAAWIYWLLALICALALISLVINRSKFAIQNSQFIFILLVPLFFLPLPLARFILSGGSIVETAQGRHLFPAIAAISLGMGLAFANQQKSKAKYLTCFVVLLLFILSVYSLFLIQRSYPPPIPLQTTSPAFVPKNRLNKTLAPEVTLIGYQTEAVKNNVLPVSLIWQATGTPPEDYLINLAVTDPAGQPVGGWLGHPIGGQYPTRAWDKGDILRDEILIPLLPNTPAGQVELTLGLVDTLNQPAGNSILLADAPPVLQLPPPARLLPHQLRTDGLPAEAPFSYRGTVTFVVPNSDVAPKLVGPNGQTFTPTQVLSNASGSIAQFIVGAQWPSGNYHLQTANELLTVAVKNRPRQFSPPLMQHPLNANIGDMITLLGYDLPNQRVKSGESFPITLHLQANRTMGKNLSIFNHLLDQNAIQFGGADRIPQNYYTTLLWVPGEIVSDSYDVPVDANAPPGVYWLDVGLYATDKPELSLPLVVDSRPIDRNSVSIGPIKVGGPPPDVALMEAAPQNPLNIAFGNEITLLGYDLEKNNSEPETLNPELILFWQAAAMPQADYTVFVHILDSQGNLVAQADSPPAAGAYPTSLWDSGEIIKDQRLLPALSPGDYTLSVGLYRPDTFERLPVANRPDGVVTLTSFKIPAEN